MEDLIIYVSRRDEKPWKYGGYLDTFRKKYKGGPKLLIFEEVIEKSQIFLHMEQEMKRLFDEIEGKGEKDQPKPGANISYTGGEWEPAPGILQVRGRWEPTSADHHLRKPNICSRKLVVSKLVAS